MPITPWHPNHLGRLQREVYDVLEAAGPNGLTPLEINTYCATAFGARYESSYRKRLSELVERGLAYDTGRTRYQDGSDRKVFAILPRR